jgi:hypothetical protein
LKTRFQCCTRSPSAPSCLAPALIPRSAAVMERIMSMVLAVMVRGTGGGLGQERRAGRPAASGQRQRPAAGDTAQRVAPAPSSGRQRSPAGGL